MRAGTRAARARNVVRQGFVDGSNKYSFVQEELAVPLRCVAHTCIICLSWCDAFMTKIYCSFVTQFVVSDLCLRIRL